MADLGIQGEVSVSSEKAEAAFDRVADKAEQMAADVAGAAGKAGKAVDGIGDGAVKGADQFTRAEARMRDAIQRTTHDLQLLGKTASEKLEFKIDAKGLDSAKFAPYLAELKAIEAAQSAVASSAQSTAASVVAAQGNIGMSAKATAAAMRQVPAQVQDIIVSLQGGQAPMTVMLQQGGQLATVFGGVGAAAKALGTYLVGLINPYTVLAAAAVALGVAYYQGSKESSEFNKAIILSGNAAGQTVDSLTGMANAIAETGRNRGAAVEALTEITRQGLAAGDSLQSFAQVAIDMERTTGQAISKTVDQFSALANEPAAASAKLNKEVGYLTAAIYEQIKALEGQGRSADAAKLAQEAFANSMAQRTSQVVNNAGLMERAWNAVAGAVKGAWAAMQGIGRAQSKADELADVTQQLAGLQRSNDGSAGAFGRFQGDDQQIAALRQRQAALQEEIRQTQKAAEAEASRQRVQKAGVEAIEAVSKANDKALSKTEQMNKALTDYRRNIEAIRKANPNSELLDPKLISRTEAGIRDQYKERAAKGSKGSKSGVETGENEVAKIRALIQEEERYIQTLRERGAEADKMSSGERMVLQIQEQLQGGIKGVARANKEAALEEAKRLAAAQKSSAAIVAGLKEEQALKQAQARFDRERQTYTESVMRETSGMAARNKALADEIQAIGMTRAQLGQLERARIDEAIAAKQQKLAAVELFDAYGEEAEAIREQIKLLEKRKELVGQKVDAQDMLDEQQRVLGMFQSIDSTAHDVFVNIFEDGAGTFKRLGQTMKAAVLDMLYQLTIKRWIINIGASLTGMDVGVVAQALGGGKGGGLGGLFNNASSANSLYGMFGGTGGNWGAISGFASGGMSWGNMLGSMYANTTGTGISGLLATNGAYGTAAGGMGSAGGLAGIAGGVAMVALPLIAGMLAENNMRDRVGGAAYATSDWRKDPTTTAGSGIVYDTATGQLPAYQAMVERMVSLGYDQNMNWYEQFKGNERALYMMMQFAEGEASSMNERQPLPDAQTLIERYGDFYRGQGYADPESLGWWNWKDNDAVSIDPAVVAASRQLSQSVIDPLAALARKLGAESDFTAITGWANRGKGKLWGAARIQQGDETIVDMERGDYENAQEYMRAVYGSALEAFETFDLPGWAERLVDDAQAQMDALTGDQVGSEAEALYRSTSQSIIATMQIMDKLGTTLPGFANMTDEAVTALLEAAGGVDALASSAQTFYQAYTSRTQQIIDASAELGDKFAELGLTMPTSRRGLQELIEAQIALGEEGAETAAALLNLSGDFATMMTGITEATGITADSIQGLFDSVIENAGSAEEAQRMASEQFGSIVMDGMMNAITGTVSDMLMTGLIAPMLESIMAGSVAAGSALATGGVIGGTAVAQGGAAGGSAVAQGGAAGGAAVAQGGAVGGAIVSDVVAQAQGYIRAMSQILNDPTVQAGISEIGASIGQIGGSLYSLNSSMGGLSSSIGGSVGGGGGGGGGAKQAVDSLAESLKKLGSTIADEVKRLRGLTTEQSEFGLAYLQAQFATNTAQARAGDLGALGKLTDLSKSIEDMAKSTAMGEMDNVRMRAWLADSLETTLNKLGLKLEDFDNPEKTEVSGSGLSNSNSQQSSDNISAVIRTVTVNSNADLLIEIRGLRAEVAELKAAANATAQNTRDLPQMADQFDNVTEGGNGMRAKVMNDIVKVKVLA